MTGVWASEGTETEADATGGGSSSAQVDGKSYYIAGTYIAGKGSTKATGMRSNGFKMRTGSDGARVVFTVNTGYEITGLAIQGVSNYALADGKEEPCISVTKVVVDDETEVEFTGGTFPAKGASDCGVLTISGIKASKSVAIYFNNENASGTQLNACYDVSWTMLELGYPTSTTVTPQTGSIPVGKTLTLKGEFTGGDFEGEWVSDNPEVATVSDAGVVTGVSVGEANITFQWKEDQSKDSYKATAVITVNEGFIKDNYVVAQTWDFSTMGETTLVIDKSFSYSIYNHANSKNNPVYPCTNENLTDLYIQAVYDSGKGWKIDDEGLLEGSKAGRCAAIGNVYKGDVVEFVHDSGTAFYTKNDGSDDGVTKEPLLEESNHHVYRSFEDGVMGFEMDRGKHVTSITIYNRKPVVTITDAGYATYVATTNVDFTGSGIKAYAVDGKFRYVTLTEVTKAPKGTPLLVEGAAGTYELTIPDETPAAIANNDLVAGPIVGDGSDDYYALGQQGDQVGFGLLVEGVEVPYSKAYIPSTNFDIPSGREFYPIFMETTGIETVNVERRTVSDACFNLAGQRVAQPTKGVYVVNGKKVVVK